MATIEETRQDVLRRFGTLSGRRPYPDDSLFWLQGRVPDSLISLLEALGLGTWGQGKWQVIDAARFDGLLRQTFAQTPISPPKTARPLP